MASSADDRSGPPVSRSGRARGDQAIKVAVTGKTPLPATVLELYRPTGPFVTIAGREITMAVDTAADGTEIAAETVAARFRPGDWITIGDGGERVQLLRVSGAALRLGSDLVATYDAASDEVRLADTPAGQQTLRLQYTSALSAVPVGSLTQGTVLTVDPDGVKEAHVVESVQAEYLPEGITYRVTFRDGLYAALGLGDVVNAQTEAFDLTVSLGTSSQTYADLSVDSAHARYFMNVVNGDPASLASVSLVEPPPAVRLPDAMPADIDVTAPVALTGGVVEDLTTLGDADFIDALATLEAVDV